MLVRTGGRWGSRAGGGDRSWLLIKHKDDWAGDLDITEFAPRSVKSDGDFEDILAEDNPAIWQTNRPAKGGDTGAMLATIIERAATLKAGRAGKSDQGQGAREKREEKSALLREATRVGSPKTPRGKKAAAARKSAAKKR